MAFFPWAAWVDVGLTHHGEPKTLPPPASNAEMAPEKSLSLSPSPSHEPPKATSEEQETFTGCRRW